MHRHESFLGILALAASLAGPRALAAQCPDGNPPPCRSAAPARITLDENLIAVFPFRITGIGSDATSLREGAMDLLGLALDEQAGLRVVPSRTLLARARNFTDATSVDDAAALARGLGAGTMILGNAVLVGGQLRARAELHDVSRRRPVASVEARGSASDPGPVIDSLAFGLARLRLASTDIVRRPLSEYATTSPAALRLFLDGERLSRRGRWQEAADSLLRAIAIDSSFALAMYRLVVVNTYGGTIEPWTADVLVTRAIRSPDRIPRRQADLLQTSYAILAGEYREAMRRAEALMTRHPDDPEAAYAAGEAFYHVGLAFGERPQRALQAFDRAIALDSGRVDPYGHVAELRMMVGDTAGALAMAQRAVAIAPSSGVHRATLLAARAIAGHEEPAALAAEAAREQPPTSLVRTAYEAWRMLSADRERATDLAGRFYALGAASERHRQERPNLLGGLARARIVQGRLAEARQVADSLEGYPETATFQRLRLIASLKDGADLAASTAGLLTVPRPGAQTLGLLGLAAVKLDRQALLDSVIAGLHDIARREPITEAHTAALVATLQGLNALERGDSASALRLLPMAYGVLPFGLADATRFEDAMQWGVLGLARLEAARGLTAQAQSRLDYFNFATGLSPLRAEADELRARLGRQPRP